MQGQAQAIQKTNNIIYFWLNQLRLNLVTNKYKPNSSYNGEYLAKNLDTISNDPIIENNLLKLNLHILAPGYLEDGPSRFTEIIEDKDEDVDISPILKKRKR